MIRTSFVVILSFLSLSSLGLGLAAPQAPGSPSAQEMLSSTLADLRGRSETIDTSRQENVSGPTVVGFSLFGGSPSVGRPSLTRESAGTVSVKRLRHRPPKPARQAFERGARTKDATKAATLLETAVGLDSEFAEAHNDLGVVYVRLGRYPEAVAELSRAIELVPDELIPRSNLAKVLFVISHRVEAKASVR